MSSSGLDVEVSGEGRDLVLLHSLLTDRSSFADLAARLAPQRRVSLVNLPGFGASPPAKPLAGFADAVVAFLDEGKVAEADVIGNGLGSFVALNMAARHGARVGRVVLIGGAVAFPDAGRATFRTLAEKAEGEGMAAIADVALRRMFTEEFIAANPAIAEERKAVFLKVEPRTFAAAARSLATLDLSAELARIRNPILIVVGEKDSATPPALGRDLAERLPDGHIIELSGVGHAPQLHAPERLIAAITPFLGLN